MGTRRLRTAVRTTATGAAAALLLTLAPGDQSTTAQIALAAETGERAATNPGDRPTVRGLPRIDGAYRFVSHPDFLNQDVGDVRSSPFWRRGMPNSTNDSYEASLDHVIGQMLRHDPEALLVAGDMVEGAWGQDVTRAGVFGPTSTLDQRRRAVREAARVYLKQWHQRFAERGLPVLPAIGDHEIGDDPGARPATPTKTPGCGSRASTCGCGRTSPPAGSTPTSAPPSAATAATCARRARSATRPAARPGTRRTPPASAPTSSSSPSTSSARAPAAG